MKKNRLLFCFALFSTITAGNYSNYNYDSNPVINPPIIVATICGNLSEVKKECTPTTMNVQNIQGQTALMHSCIHGSGDIFTFLIENNADLNIKDNSGKTALDYAIKHNRADMIEFLLLSGANDTLSLDKALKKAAEFENIKKQTQNMLEELSKDLPDINIIKSCIDNGADVNANLDLFINALSKAAINGDTEMVKLLIATGADVNAKDNNGETRTAQLIKDAAKNGHIEIVKLLINAGADINAKDGYGDTVLLYSSRSYYFITQREKYRELSKLFIESGADVNAENYGCTALNCATYYGEIEIVKLLLAAGVDVDAKDNDGKTALMLAKDYNYPEIVKLLKQHANKKIVKKTATNKQNNRAKLTNKAKIILSKKIRRK